MTDTWNHRIQKFSPDGTFLTSWGSEGSGNGQFDSPHGVAVDGSDNVYVADSDNNRIQKFTPGVTFLTSWGIYGSQNGQFYYPHGVSVDAGGTIYVADVFNLASRNSACEVESRNQS